MTCGYSIALRDGSRLEAARVKREANAVHALVRRSDGDRPEWRRLHKRHVARIVRRRAR